LIEKLLYIKTVKDEVLSEELNIAKTILTGRENFVNALDYFVWDHS
jgi:hypothetical protein